MVLPFAKRSSPKHSRALMERMNTLPAQSPPPEEEEPVVDDEEEEEDDLLPPPQVEITGLELLMSEDGMDSDSFTFDSYAQDSFAMAKERMQMRKAPPRRRVPRRLSNCSSIGEEESYGYEVPTTYRRASMGSTYGGDGVEQYGYNRCPLQAGRRASMGSAADSVEFARYRSTTRRSSLGSYAADSVDYARYRSTARRCSISTAGSFAADSVDYGRYRSTRRSSLGSYAADSVQLRRPQRRFSNMSDYAEDSIAGVHKQSAMVLPSASNHSMVLDKMKRRLSNESQYSFPAEVYETQSINTGGASRAA